MFWLRESIVFHLTSGSQPAAFQHLLKEFRNRGGLKEDAYEILKDVRLLHQGDEETEDLILEVMDIVTGFCSPFFKVRDNE